MYDTCIFVHCTRLVIVALQDNPAVVTCLENERHGLEDGDVVVFSEVVGMERINGEEWSVKGDLYII